MIFLSKASGKILRMVVHKFSYSKTFYFLFLSYFYSFSLFLRCGWTGFSNFGLFCLAVFGNKKFCKFTKFIKNKNFYINNKKKNNSYYNLYNKYYSYNAIYKNLKSFKIIKNINYDNGFRLKFIGINFYGSKFYYYLFVILFMLKCVFFNFSNNLLKKKIFFTFNKKGKRNFFYLFNNYDIDKKDTKKIKMINLSEKEVKYINKINKNKSKSIIKNKIDIKEIKSIINSKFEEIINKIINNKIKNEILRKINKNKIINKIQRKINKNKIKNEIQRKMSSFIIRRHIVNDVINDMIYNEKKKYKNGVLVKTIADRRIKSIIKNKIKRRVKSIVRIKLWKKIKSIIKKKIKSKIIINKITNIMDRYVKEKKFVLLLKNSKKSKVFIDLKAWGGKFKNRKKYFFKEFINEIENKLNYFFYFFMLRLGIFSYSNRYVKNLLKKKNFFLSSKIALLKKKIKKISLNLKSKFFKRLRILSKFKSIIKKPVKILFSKFHFYQWNFLDI